MAVAQLKNLQRRLQLLSAEAEQGLTRSCGHELWKSLGPDAIDMFDSPVIKKLSDRYSFAIKDLTSIGPDMKITLRKENV